MKTTLATCNISTDNYKIKPSTRSFWKQGINLFALIICSLPIFAQVAPAISSFSPASGTIGTTVVITGTNFSVTPASNVVYFGAVKATVSAATSTSLNVTVPAGSTYQPITVTTRNLTAYSANPFIVIFCSGPVNNSSFVSKTDFTTGTGPYSVFAGDLDGDGKADMVTTNNSDNSVSVFLNTSVVGTVSFAAKTDFATGSAPYSVYLADIDGDGKQDIIVTNRSSNTISLLKNTSSAGSISFTAKADFVTGIAPIGLSVNDLDGDGKADIAVANSNSVSILRNTSTVGNFSFDTKVDFPTGTGTMFVVLGDLDGDSRPDMAVTNGGANTVSVFKNTGTSGNITFAAKSDYPMISYPTGIAMSDLDGDGKKDLAVSDGFGISLSVLRNISSAGSISFATRADIATGGGPFTVSAGDINGDGKPDLVTGNDFDFSASVLQNTSTVGTISFAATVDLPAGNDPLSTAICDLDGDGKADIVTGNFSGSNFSVLRNTISGTAATVTSFTPTSASQGATITITGTNFTGATAVSFGGVAAASFTVVSATTITAVVGTGASGSVNVTTACGTATISGFTLMYLPISVTASAGTTGPSTYATLKLAFDAINSGVHQGIISVSVTANTTETASAVLNASGSGIANYSSVGIRPTGGGARMISGSFTGALIDLNGADYVTIDGLNTGGNSLTITNPSTATNTCTIRYLSDATNNIIKNCLITGSGTSADFGTILFSTGSSTGNSGNTVNNNNIGSAGVNFPLNAIYSGGTAATPNTNNTISNNNVYNYAAKGIDVAATGSSVWTIIGNSFYKEANVFDTYNTVYSVHGIRILGGSGYTISNNYIGGESSQLGGNNATYNSTGNLAVTGILLTTSSATPASNIKGNTISKMKASVVMAAANSPVSYVFFTFNGIETSGSGINVGGIIAGEGNTIGSNSANGVISISTSTTSTANSSTIYGIYFHSTGGLILGNQVAGFDINNMGSSPGSSNFRGIYVSIASPPTQVNNNIIGSTVTAASIRVLSTSTATATNLTGIYLGSTITSALPQVNGNIIQNISHLSAVSSATFNGINTQNGYVQSYQNNIIRNIYAAANASASSLVYTGIQSSTSLSPSTIIANNTIDNIDYESSGINAKIRGMDISGSSPKVTTIDANVISNLTTLSQKTGISDTDDPGLFTITGILFSTGGASSVISNNNLYNFSSLTTGSTKPVIAGLGIISTGGGNIHGNRISGFSNSAAGGGNVLAGIIGIKAYKGTFNVYNNSIRLNNASFTNSVNIYGIIQNTAGTSWNYFHNSISIGGTASSGTATRTAALIRTTEGGVLLKNNVFVNTRTGTGTNYAISNNVASPSATWLSSSSNYNDLYSSNANTLAEWGNGVGNTFSQFKTNSGGEANSVSRPVSFISSDYDLQPVANLNCVLSNAGIPITTPVVISTDLNSAARSATAPDLGAYEYSYVAPVHIATNDGPKCIGSDVNLSVTTGNGVSPFDYSWIGPASFSSTSQNPVLSSASSLMAGLYSVTVADANGCSASAQTTVVVNTLPAGTLTSNPGNTISSGTTVIFTATDGLSYNFKLNGNSVQSGTSPTYTNSSLSAGNAVSVTVTNSNGCNATYPSIVMTVSNVMVNGKLYLKLNDKKVQKWNGINKVN